MTDFVVLRFQCDFFQRKRLIMPVEKSKCSTEKHLAEKKRFKNPHKFCEIYGNHNLYIWTNAIECPIEFVYELKAVIALRFCFGVRSALLFIFRWVFFCVCTYSLGSLISINFHYFLCAAVLSVHFCCFVVMHGK